MKKLLILLIHFISTMVYAETMSSEKVRLLYQKAATEKQSCKELINLLHAYTEQDNPVLAGYKACATMMMAKHVLNPIDKLAHFSKGKKLLERSINEDRNNIELRFLRFSMQTNAPAFLGYRHSIDQDKIVLLNAVPQLKDTTLKQLIVSALLRSDMLTLTEQQKLKS